MTNNHDELIEAVRDYHTGGGTLSCARKLYSKFCSNLEWYPERAKCQLISGIQVALQEAYEQGVMSHADMTGQLKAVESEKEEAALYFETGLWHNGDISESAKLVISSLTNQLKAKDALLGECEEAVRLYLSSLIVMPDELIELHNKLREKGGE